MNQLFYPTIDLFTYDLKTALNLSSEEIEQQRQAFLAKFPPEVRANFRESTNEVEYFELFIDPKTGYNKFKLKPQNPALDGYYYPVRINDVYALQLDCSVDNLAEPQDVGSFADIKTEIANKIAKDELTIGQTWFVSGWLTEADRQNATAIAQASYQVLFPGQDWQQGLYAQGDFLNSKLFEIWQREAYPHHHVVILLFPNKEMAIKGSKFYADWMGLFCYRHKITWAYHQSRSIKASLVNHYRKIEENAKIIKQNQYGDNNLTSTEARLDNIQDILDQYTFDLLNLTFQKQIIEINLVNYQRRVELIQQKSQAGNNLDELDKFDHFVGNKYLAQINKDTENMQLGIKLLENNISAMSGKIELEKQEKELNFQALVTFIGTGMAGAGLVKSESITCTAVFGKLPVDCENIFVKELSVPISLILIFGFLGWLVRLTIKKL